MGKKSSGARQYVFLCAPIVPLLGGCALFPQSPEPLDPLPPAVAPEPAVPAEPEIVIVPREVRERREASERLQLAQSLLAKGDYDGSLRESRKVLTLVNDQSPANPWAEQAKIWVGVLDGVEKLKQVDIDIEEKKRDRLR